MTHLFSKLTNTLRYRGREAASYLLNYTKSASSDSVKVIIFAQGRTGSTLLESLLCSTGHFSKNGELFDKTQGQSEVLFPIQFVRGLSKWKSTENFIFHTKIYQLTQNRKRPIEPNFFLEKLYLDGWKIIYLRRNNKVKHVLSNIVVESRGPRDQVGTWHKFDDKQEKLNVFVDCERLVRKVEKRFRFDAYEREVLANIKYHEVVYEEDLEKSTAHQKTVDSILDYLGLEHREASTKHRKINNMPMAELISNYEEFIDCLKKQGWENFVKE